MSEPLELRPISADGVRHALEKAERYRLLNDPAQADSIYRDILAIDPHNQAALRGLVLALTDQLGGERGQLADREAKELIKGFDDEYDRAYYMGIVLERETRAYLQRKTAVRSGAYHGFREAMAYYEKAAHLRAEDDVDAVLRWNSCVRAIEREKLEPEPDHPELPLE
jgi:hypothetical protein